MKTKKPLRRNTFRHLLKLAKTRLVRFKSGCHLHVVASGISLATIFYALQRKSTHARSAASPFQTERASLLGSAWHLKHQAIQKKALRPRRSRAFLRLFWRIFSDSSRHKDQAQLSGAAVRSRWDTHTGAGGRAAGGRRTYHRGRSQWESICSRRNAMLLRADVNSVSRVPSSTISRQIRYFAEEGVSISTMGSMVTTPV